jgi:hypothetical protein
MSSTVLGVTSVHIESYIGMDIVDLLTLASSNKWDKEIMYRSIELSTVFLTYDPSSHYTTHAIN